jgi:hypothetical protein
MAMIRSPSPSCASHDVRVDRIDAHPGLDLTFHVGDIKNGSSPCTNDYNAMIREQFDRFTMPMLYTPGDNEWTDCHHRAEQERSRHERYVRLSRSDEFGYRHLIARVTAGDAAWLDAMVDRVADILSATIGADHNHDELRSTEVGGWPDRSTCSSCCWSTPRRTPRPRPTPTPEALQATPRRGRRTISLTPSVG